ncbi:hypothetical protein DM02DRAFT_186055 [Periconia macrospinosa]|uniref:Secreted protein n=1 Tax=Periconia macrospinosa TaxID=97972 RepID=A0A2V1D964_9PLEO|nr:hypothetical protein DM02DRAFT_186055 [Periconia macrospinosa]
MGMIFSPIMYSLLLFSSPFPLETDTGGSPGLVRNVVWCHHSHVLCCCWYHCPIYLSVCLWESISTIERKRNSFGMLTLHPCLCCCWTSEDLYYLE